MDAGFGIGIALHADGLTRTFASAGVGRGALAADRQAAQMPHPAITFDALQAFEVHAQFAAQVAFDHILAVLNGVNNLGQLLFVKVLGADGRIDFRLGQDDLGIGRANAEHVAQSDIDSLLARNFNSNNSCHKFFLTLSLFVAGIRANDTNNALPFDNFAVFAKFFD